MGFRQPVRRSTLADANGRECGVGPAAHQARTLYVDEELGLDLTNTDTPWTRRPSLCACRSVGAPHHQAAVKMHTLLDLRGNIPSFIHISQAARRSCPRYALESTRGSSTSTLPRVAPSRGLLRPPSELRSQRLFGADGSLDRHHLRPDHPLDGFYTRQDPRTSAAHPLQGSRVRQAWSSSPTTSCFRPPPSARLQKPLAGNSSSSGSSASSVKRIAVSVYVLVASSRSASPGRLALHTDPLARKCPTSSTCRCNASQIIYSKPH